MKDLRQILKRPIVTEKSTLVKDSDNQLVFEVDPSSTKVEIWKSVEEFFKVKVLKVRTINFKGKKKRVGKSLGRRNHWKKAYVSLALGNKVDIFDGI